MDRCDPSKRKGIKKNSRSLFFGHTMMESVHYIPPYALCRRRDLCDLAGQGHGATTTATTPIPVTEHYEPAPGGAPPSSDPPPIVVGPTTPAPASVDAAPSFPVPVPLSRPTLIVWWSKDCSACKNSGPTFRALQKNQSGWEVVQLEATRDVIMRYPSHILSLPMYDFLTPSPNASASANPLGIPGVSVTTVRNNSPGTLVAMVPDLSVGAH